MSRNRLFFIHTLTTTVSAYSFIFNSFPTQCGNVNVSLTGSGGTPPYRISLVPFGGSPLSNNQEVRRIMDVQFNDSTNVVFKLPYPTNSQFVATVSDKNGAGFGTGGTSIPVNVQGSSDNSCLPTSQVKPGFTFSSDPLGSLTTCQSSLLVYDNTQSQGSVNFWGMIPGGDSFSIPSSNPTPDSSNVGQNQPAISYTPPIRSGVVMLIVAGDNRGFGSGGSFQVALQPGNGTTSCIGGDSPISTSGSPAGGAYPTNQQGGVTNPTSTSGSSSASSTTTSSTGSSSTSTGSSSSPSSAAETAGAGSTKKANHTGVIAGAVVGSVAGLALLGLLLLLCLRRRRDGSKRNSAQSVDLLGREINHSRDSSIAGAHDLPDHYEATPFQMSEHHHSGSIGPTGMSRSNSYLPQHAYAVGGGALARQWSGVSGATTPRERFSSEGSHDYDGQSYSPVGGGFGGMKGGKAPSSYRPPSAGVFQHTDGGASPVGKGVMHEVPPAYTHIRTSEDSEV